MKEKTRNSANPPSSLRTVMIKCPKTGLPVSTGIATGESTNLVSHYLQNKVEGPHCGEVHIWSGGEAFFGD